MFDSTVLPIALACLQKAAWINFREEKSMQYDYLLTLYERLK
ncbi:hypothetical protein [Microcoleus sp. Z1_B2]